MITINPYSFGSGVYNEYGALYNWYAATYNTGGASIAPAGWHVPSKAEWDTLVTTAGGASVAGVKLKKNSYTYWNIPNTGAYDAYVFSVLGAGLRSGVNGIFQGLKASSYHWSSTTSSTDNAWIINSYYNNITTPVSGGPYKHGCAIRLIKDDSTNPGTLTDYDGNVYKTVKIGSQVWTAQNLQVKHYNDGTSIPLVTDPTTWMGLTTGAYCGYDNNTNFKPIYLGTCTFNYSLSAPDVPGTWVKLSGPGTPSFSPNATTHDAVVTVDAYGEYRFQYNTTIINVAFYQQPIANPGTGGNVYETLSYTFNVPEAQPGNCTWVKTSGPGTATFVDEHDMNTTVTVSVGGVYSFTLYWTNGTCSNAASVNVNINWTNAGSGGDGDCVFIPTPYPASLPSDITFTLSAVPINDGGEWAKISGPGTVVFTPDKYTPTAEVSVSQFGTYVFEWSEMIDGIRRGSDITVIFNQQPTAFANVDQTVTGLSATLNAVPSVGAGTWTRYSGPGTAVFTPNANTPNVTVTVSQTGIYVFRWTEVNGTCSSTDEVAITFNA
jgi:uncharacterized protein (TIGR02145 family)